MLPYLWFLLGVAATLFGQALWGMYFDGPEGNLADIKGWVGLVLGVATGLWIYLN